MSGSTMVFRIYGLVCAGMLVLFTLVNFYNMKEGGFSTELGEDIDPRNVMESEHLAPHGVPGGFKPMPRSRRNSGEEVQAAVTQPNPMDDPGMETQKFMVKASSYTYTVILLRINIIHLHNMGTHYT